MANDAILAGKLDSMEKRVVTIDKQPVWHVSWFQSHKARTREEVGVDQADGGAMAMLGTRTRDRGGKTLGANAEKSAEASMG